MPRDHPTAAVSPYEDPACFMGLTPSGPCFPGGEIPQRAGPPARRVSTMSSLSSVQSRPQPQNPGSRSSDTSLHAGEIHPSEIENPLRSSPPGVPDAHFVVICVYLFICMCLLFDYMLFGLVLLLLRSRCSL